MTGVVIFVLVVPKVMAAVPFPVLRIAKRNARVGVLGSSCNAVDAELVRSSLKVGLRIFKESMIFLSNETVKLSYVF